MAALAHLSRLFTRQRLFAALNVGGLALGIAVFLVLTLYVQHERGFNLFPGSDRLWVLQERNTGLGQTGDPRPRVMGGELDLLRADYPGIIGARYDSVGGTVRVDGRAAEQNVVLTDPDFFRLFGRRAIAGDPAQALRAPDTLVMTESCALKWFGSRAPIGATLRVTAGGKDKLYRLAAVVADIARGQEFDGDIFLRLDRDNVGSDWYDRWDKGNLWTFLSFTSDDAAASFERELLTFLARRAFPTALVRPNEYSQSLLPLSAVHLSLTNANGAVLTTLLSVGSLTLVIAILNYVNLATARSGQRAREIAMRKVLGATRRQLLVQFLSEALAMAALAVLVGFALAELSLPWINAMGGTSLAIDYSGELLLAIPMLVLGIAIAAGLYPAIVLSRHQPAQILVAASASSGGPGGTRLRRGLVVVQFAVAVAFAIVTAVMLTQVAYMARADLGFTRDGLLIVETTDFGSLDRARAMRLAAVLGTLPNVADVVMSDTAPGWILPADASNISRSDDPQRKVAASLMPIESGYFEAYRSRLLAGRLFDAAHGTDDMVAHNGISAGANIVINRTAAISLGFLHPEDAIGHVLAGGALRNAQIIGVIEDMRFGDPHTRQRPTLYARDPQSFGSAFTLRFRGTDARSLTDAVERQWKKTAPDIPFQVQSASESLDGYYQADRQRARLFTLGAVLAVVIGCIGLYGLAAFDTARRTREIGIRKTLGASTRDIMRLLLAGFLRPVLLANLVAWPVAYVGLRRWLAGFDDHITLSPLFFFGASAVAVLVATATVVAQSWKVARAEPARALRYG